MNRDLWPLLVFIGIATFSLGFSLGLMIGRML